MDLAQLLANQIISLSWIRCLQEEGVDFRHKITGEVESDERLIFEAFEEQTGDFDLPSAKASRFGMEKNILEVYGSYCLSNDDPVIIRLLNSPEFKNVIREKIKLIKESKP